MSDRDPLARFRPGSPQGAAGRWCEQMSQEHVMRPHNVDLGHLLKDTFLQFRGPSAVGGCHRHLG